MTTLGPGLYRLLPEGRLSAAGGRLTSPDRAVRSIAYGPGLSGRRVNLDAPWDLVEYRAAAH